MNDPIRIYLIGAGVIARTHAAAAMTKLPAPAELVVTDPRADAVSAFVGQFPQARTFADVETMLREPARADDIVIVATPPASHAALSLSALGSGRHVLCEKPLAMNTSQAMEMLSAARAAARLIGCCSTRFLDLPTSACVKDLLAGGALGKLYHASFIRRNQRSRSGVEYQSASRWFLDASQSGGGTIMDWAPYDFAALNDLLSPVRVEVHAAWMARPLTAADPADRVNDVEQHAGASLVYHLPDGTMLPVTYERAACTHGEPRHAAEIEGLAGAVRWNWLGSGTSDDVVIATDDAGKVREEKRAFAPPDESSLKPTDKPLVFFDRAVRGQFSPALVNERAIFNFRCLRAIYDCASQRTPQVVA